MTRRRTALAILLRGGEVLMAIVAFAAWTIAVVGRLASDSVPAVQKVSWIPVPALAAAMGVAILAMAGARRLRQSVLAPAEATHAGRAPKAFGGVVAIAAALLALLVADHLLHRWGLPRACRDSIRIVHWNAASPSQGDAPRASDALAALDAEILVVSNDWWLFGRPFTRTWSAEERTVHRAGPFALVTDLPMREARLVLAAGGRWAGLFRVAHPDGSARELSILAVDLPSATDLPRRDLAEALRHDLERLELPQIDLVVGDFNMDAGSASLAAAFPAHRSAFDLVGEGYAASYPRTFPLWHPDQILVGEGLEPCGYRLIDLGVGSHRAQELRLSVPSREAP